MDQITVGELWQFLGISEVVPPTLYGFTLVLGAVLFLPVWISLLRGKLLTVFVVAWKAYWGLLLIATLLLSPFGISRYVQAWRLALV